jgi:hypothetical protein
MQDFSKTSPSKSGFIDDEYIDDDFEVEEESGSIMTSSNPQVMNNLKE